MKKQKQLKGSIIKIPLNKEYHTYARVLEDPYVAFYNIKAQGDNMDLAKIISSPILFITSVIVDRALKNGAWQVVGEFPLEEELQKPIAFYMTDTTNPNQFFLYKESQMIPATREECIGLELVAIWHQEHIESRLKSHYLGTKFEWGDDLPPLKP